MRVLVLALAVLIPACLPGVADAPAPTAPAPATAAPPPPSATAATAATETIAFSTVLGGKPLGTETVTLSSGEAGPVLDSTTTLTLPGGATMKLVQHATLTADRTRFVAYTLDVTGAGQNARLDATTGDAGWKVAVTPAGAAEPAMTREIAAAAGSGYLLDNNLGSHLDVICRGLKLGDGEKLSGTAIVPQVMAGVPMTITRTSDAGGRLSGVDVALKTYRLQAASVLLDLSCRATDGALMQARVPMQTVTYTREGFEPAAAGAAASETDAGADARERATAIASAAGKLEAVLTVPKAAAGPEAAPVAGIVMLSGSGPNDRDETIGPNKPFRDLARALADRGVATLRFDKRTVAHKNPALSSTLRDEYVADALLAIAELRATPGVDPARVYVLGHSLGVLAALQTAREAPAGQVRGLVLMAGPARAVDALLLDQISHQQKLAGATQADIDAQRKQIEDVFAAYRDPKAASLPPFLGAPGAYWRDLMRYDAGSMLAETALPVLVLQGEADIQVRKDLDFDALRTKVGTKDGRIAYRSFPALNHLFMKVDGPSTGAEYGIAGHVAAEVPAAIAEWIAPAPPKP